MVIFGTGYERNVHEALLKPVKGVMRGGRCEVGRDYAVVWGEGKVEDGVRVYLQGCCEQTHGVSLLNPGMGDSTDLGVVE